MLVGKQPSKFITNIKTRRLDKWALNRTIVQWYLSRRKLLVNQSIHTLKIKDCKPTSTIKMSDCMRLPPDHSKTILETLHTSPNTLYLKSYNKGKGKNSWTNVRLEQPNTNWAKCIVFDLSCGTRRRGYGKRFSRLPAKRGVIAHLTTGRWTPATYTTPCFLSIIRPPSFLFLT